MLSAEHLYDWLVHEHATAFATVKNGRLVAVLIVMTVNYSNYRVARIIACGGKDLRGAMEFVDALEAWAFTQGCVEIEGWVLEPMRRLSKWLGWKTKRTIIYRDLRRKLQ